MEQPACLKCKNLLQKIKDDKDLIKYYKERLLEAERKLALHKASIDYTMENNK